MSDFAEEAVQDKVRLFNMGIGTVTDTDELGVKILSEHVKNLHASAFDTRELLDLVYLVNEVVNIGLRLPPRPDGSVAELEAHKVLHGELVSRGRGRKRARKRGGAHSGGKSSH
jgi:hypothetical protein